MQGAAKGMIESEDAVRVIEVLTRNLEGIAKNPANFQRLPDSFWGYYARGHDGKGRFGVIVTYSEDETDVDDVMRMYEAWLAKNRSRPEDPQ